MAYQTGSASDQTDLMNKLQVFAAANGFTVEHYSGVNRLLYISRAADSLYAGFAWDGANHIGVYQALGYSAGSVSTPWAMPGDSGNGVTSLAQLYKERNVNNIANGPFPTYHFFGYTNPYAIHVVLEFSAGIYRHFGFGKLEKVGNWIGGAWVAGHHWNSQRDGSSLGVPNSGNHSILLDSAFYPLSSYYDYCYRAAATMHAEQLPLQPASSKWAMSCHPGMDSSYLSADRAGNAKVRISGGCRGGMAMSQFGWLVPNLASGFIPLVPMEVFYIDQQASSSSCGWYHLGRVPNVYHVHMQGIDPAQEIVYGGSTYLVFPGVRKSRIATNNQESWNMGIVYKKVT